MTLVGDRASDLGVLFLAVPKILIYHV
nr:hypothetical protein [Tanacetum cinerariifolium]